LIVAIRRFLVLCAGFWVFGFMALGVLSGTLPSG